ncbi:hypothetical protein EV175_001392 [Coemansia sp. RSA 1933]|nr:hypothetical protein EV175_001392 [Coemansia sp. RSA 1933]
MRSLSLSSYGFKPDHTETNYLWTLVRPGKSPRDLVRMFLLLSARAAQLQRSHVEPDAIVAVGSQWYSLLADLCVQLGLSAYEFGDWTLKDIQAASRLFEPGAREHSEVYSVLWNIRNKDDIENFDANWKAIQKLTKGLGNARTVEKSAGDLYERCSPHSFCNKLCVYFTAVLDFLEPPTLDYYTSIRQVERLPYGFFNTANNVAVQGLPNSPHVDDDDEEQIAMDTNIMLLDPFSPQAQRAISNLHIRDSGGVCRSPSERVAQAHAYNTMSSESNHTQAGSLAAPPTHGVASSSSASETLLHHSGLARMPTSPRLESESALMLDDDGFDSDESDMEMSPSRHASSKRQKSNEHVSSPSKQITPRRNGHSRPSAEGMDIDSSVILESPSAMLSAKHDKRMKKSVLMRTQAPPALSFGPVKNGSPSVEANDANSGHAAVNSSAMTTPKSQTGEKMVDTPKYVAGRAYGDVEGGGRPHRRRHNADSFGTPKAARSSVLEPPPQTLLSPRNIAAARRNNIGLDALVSQYENHTSDNVVMDLTNTPQRSNNAAEMLKDLETTPENQIGQAADAQASSVSRYVKRKDQGDIEGGGRKHRNRQRGGGYDPLLFMGSS